MTIGARGVSIMEEHVMATLRRATLASLLFVGLALPQTAMAGPYLGDWGWLWHPAGDCPRGSYCCLHYTNPGIYTVRSCLFRSNLDDYPPGPSPSPPSTITYQHYPCRSAPAAPTAPYSDPAGYFGRSPAVPPPPQ
jgi:hypothetical protein